MTAQATDCLRYRGELLRIFTLPLETLPPERRRSFMPTGNSANWRGYVALWEIRDDRLYLADIRGSICNAPVDPGAKVKACGAHHYGTCALRDARTSDFSAGSEEPIFADWFTGDITAARGKLVNYVHMGFESRYEGYLMLTFAAGRLQGERVVAGASPPLPGLGWLRRVLNRWT
jgi:hypothetical protein